MGIYIGFGDIIDAPHTGANVEIDSLSEPWFRSRYDGARRIVGAAVGGMSQTGTTTAFTSGSGTSFTSEVVYFTHKGVMGLFDTSDSTGVPGVFSRFRA